jgi:putative tryptophan/tyrosine transport system substrate-binding protein
MPDMKRREFIALIAGGGLPLATKARHARAQQPAVPVVGFLHQGAARPNGKVVDAFRRGLEEIGYAEGRNLTFDFRWADGRYERLPALAADLVQRRPAIIAAALLPAAQAAKAATASIPVVFISNSDPIEAGLVTSINRPGGNITGVSLFSVPLNAKRLEVLHELVPAGATVGVLVNPRNPNAAANERAIAGAAEVIGLKITFVSASSDGDLAEAFAGIVRQRFSVVVVSADGFFASRREQLVALAARHAVPTMYFQREFVDLGGLISYGASSAAMYRQAGGYVGRILKGTSAGELPVLQPTRFELVINLKTAKALGLEVPPTLLARADEAIE